MPTGSRAFEAASGLLLCLVAVVAVAVGVYAIRNPNRIEYPTSWTVVSEMVAIVAGATLGLSVRRQRTQSNRALFALGCGAAIVALLMLGLVALLLSFNQL
jgi:NO-binding membrane sensor protein with MHYT domain